MTCRIAIGIYMLHVTGLARAGPPLETDDPDTPGPGNWEINVASSFEKRAETCTYTPVLDMNYGVGETLQLKVKPRIVLLDEPHRDLRSGAGNIQIGVKWRFAEGDVHDMAASVYPQIDLNPPGDSVKRGLVDDGTEFFLPFEFGCTLGSTRLLIEAGRNWREHQNDEWIIGFAGEQPLHERFKLVGEVRAIAHRDFSDAEILFNAGFKWSLRPDLILLASAGTTLRAPRGESSGVFSYLGLQTTF